MGHGVVIPSESLRSSCTPVLRSCEMPCSSPRSGPELWPFGTIMQSYLEILSIIDKKEPLFIGYLGKVA